MVILAIEAGLPRNAGDAACRQSVYLPWRASVEMSLPVLVAVATVAGVGCSGGSPNDLPVAIVHRRDHKGFPLV